MYKLYVLVVCTSFMNMLYLLVVYIVQIAIKVQFSFKLFYFHILEIFKFGIKRMSEH